MNRNDAAFPPARVVPTTPRLRKWRTQLYAYAAGGLCNAGFVSPDDKSYFGQNQRSMTDSEERAAPAQGLEGVLLANRDRLIGFLVARGAGDGAEDLFQELWMQLSGRHSGPIGEPISYLYRAANNLMLDRYRSARQADLRDQAWGEAAAGTVRPVDAALISRQQLAEADATIDALGKRAAGIFRAFRLEGKSQRAIAAEFGVSLSTVESDLRKVYGALAALRRIFNER